MAGKILVSVSLLCLCFTLKECAPRMCWEGCLYSVIAPTCSNRGTLLRYNLDPTSNISTTLDMCGEWCNNNNRTKFYLVREGFQKISIRLVLDCRYALSAESGSLTVQKITKVNNAIPTKFLFKSEAVNSDTTYRTIGAPHMYLALARPDQAALSASRTKNTQFNFLSVGYVSLTCSV